MTRVLKNYGKHRIFKCCCRDVRRLCFAYAQNLYGVATQIIGIVEINVVLMGHERSRDKKTEFFCRQKGTERRNNLFSTRPSRVGDKKKKFSNNVKHVSSIAHTQCAVWLRSSEMKTSRKETSAHVIVIPICTPTNQR